MKGAARAAKRKHETDISLAWHVAAFNGAVQTGKFKDLNVYLGIKKQPQTPDQMLNTLQVLQSMGAPMDITEIN